MIGFNRRHALLGGLGSILAALCPWRKASASQESSAALTLPFKGKIPNKVVYGRPIFDFLIPIPRQEAWDEATESERLSLIFDLAVEGAAKRAAVNPDPALSGAVLEKLKCYPWLVDQVRHYMHGIEALGPFVRTTCKMQTEGWETGVIRDRWDFDRIVVTHTQRSYWQLVEWPDMKGCYEDPVAHGLRVDGGLFSSDKPETACIRRAGSPEVTIGFLLPGEKRREYHSFYLPFDSEVRRAKQLTEKLMQCFPELHKYGFSRWASLQDWTHEGYVPRVVRLWLGAPPLVASPLVP